MCCGIPPQCKSTRWLAELGTGAGAKATAGAQCSEQDAGGHIPGGGGTQKAASGATHAGTGLVSGSLTSMQRP